MKFASVEIRCNGNTSSVVIDGKEVSHKVSAIVFQHEGGDYPRVYLEIPVDSVSVVGSQIQVKKQCPVPRPLRFFRRRKERTL